MLVLQVSTLKEWFRIAERSESFSVPIDTLAFVFETRVFPNSVKVGASVDTHLCLPKTKPTDEYLSRRIIVEWNESVESLVLRKVLLLFSSLCFWNLRFSKLSQSGGFYRHPFQSPQNQTQWWVPFTLNHNRMKWKCGKFSVADSFNFFSFLFVFKNLF